MTGPGQRELAPGAVVPTVRGLVPASELGTTLMHEHLYTDWLFGVGREQGRFEDASVRRRIGCALEGAAEAGVSAIVDVGTELFGPSPLLLLAIATDAPVHIVCSTGCFTADMLPPPEWLYAPVSTEAIAQRFIAAARDGVDGSGVKPGIIKVATGGRAISEIEEMACRAAAAAQRETGLAITTHTHLTTFADQQVDIFEDAGADLDRVVIGHMGWGSTAGDFDLHQRLAARGVTIGLDMVGSPARSDEEYADIAFDLIEAGHAGQIVLSHDTAAYGRGLDGVFEAGYMHGDFGTLFRGLLPLLRERGVDDATLTSILVDNPARILGIDPDRYPAAAATTFATEGA